MTNLRDTYPYNTYDTASGYIADISTAGATALQAGTAFIVAPGAVGLLAGLDNFFVIKDKTSGGFVSYAPILNWPITVMNGSDTITMIWDGTGWVRSSLIDPVGPAPFKKSDLATKKYVDGAISGITTSAHPTPAGNQGEPGEDGGIGPQGRRGFTGGTGATGARGRMGVPVRGSDGEDGDPGAQGRRGITGTPGSTGSRGRMGAPVPGDEGEQGDPGLQGSRGRTGATGATGGRGLRGTPLPGDQGEPGEDSPPAARGKSGARGRAGLPVPGNDGEDGDPGVPGRAGRTGRAGPRGVGLTGEDGDPGDPGIGMRGRTGSGWVSGMSAPSDSLGANGDFYLDTLNGEYWGPKAAGSWSGTGPTPFDPALLSRVEELERNLRLLLISIVQDGLSLPPKLENQFEIAVSEN